MAAFSLWRKGAEKKIFASQVETGNNCGIITMKKCAKARCLHEKWYCINIEKTDEREESQFGKKTTTA